MILLLTALFLGFLHGLGPDHLMAIAALSLGGDAQGSTRRARAIAVAVRFAAGHAVLLAAGAGLIVAIGWAIPARVERGGEMLGGALLIVMGGLTLQHLFAPRDHRDERLPRRSRVAAKAGTSHSHVPTMIGAAFAVSSLRALAMLTPFGSDLGTAPLPLLIGLIAVFAAGIMTSMVLFGVALAGVLSTRALQRLGHGAGALVGVSSIVLGVAWLATA